MAAFLHWPDGLRLLLMYSIRLPFFFTRCLQFISDHCVCITGNVCFDEHYFAFFFHWNSLPTYLLNFPDFQLFIAILHGLSHPLWLSCLLCHQQTSLIQLCLPHSHLCRQWRYWIDTVSDLFLRNSWINCALWWDFMIFLHLLGASFSQLLIHPVIPSCTTTHIFAFLVTRRSYLTLWKHFQKMWRKKNCAY